MPENDNGLILVIDDDQHFLDNLFKQAEQVGKVNCFYFLHYNAETFAEIIRDISARVEVVFIDFSLGEITAERLMTWLNKFLDFKQVRAFWFSGADTLNIDALQQLRNKYPRLSPEYLRKPFKLEDLEACLYNEFKLADQWSEFQKPLRVINKTGQVVFSNEKWLGPRNLPSPHNYIDPEQKQFINPELDYFNQRPDSAEGEAGYFRLCSFKSDDGEYFLQYSIPLNPSETGNRWQDSVEKIASALCEMGYTRLRFCRYLNVPDGIIDDDNEDSDLSQGVLALTWSSTILNDNEPRGERSTPVRKPLTGTFLERIKAMVEKYHIDRSENLLSYRIAKTPDNNDPWKDIVVPKNAQDYFVVELPLFTEHEKVKSIIGNPGLLGKLTFDRYNKEQNIFLEITDDDIQQLKKTLLSFCFELVLAMESSILKLNSKNVLKYAELDKEMAGGFAQPKDLLKNLLQHAVEDVDAITGYITEQHHSGYEVTIGWGKEGFQGDQIFQNAIYTKLAACLPSVQCWKKGKTISYSDIKGNQEDLQNILDVYKDSEQVIYTGTEPDVRERWVDYVQNRVRSLVVLPVKADNQLIATILLHSNTAYHFDYERLGRLKSLTHRASWLLTVARHLDDRKLFLDGVMHEINTNTSPLLGNLKKLNVTEQSGEPLLRCKFSAKRLKMASSNLLFLTSHNTAKDIYIDDAKSCNEMITILKELVHIYSLELKDRSLNLDFKPSLDDAIWKTVLPMSSDWFVHISNNLLDNAIKNSKNSVVVISACIEPYEGRHGFYLSVKNDGYLSPEQCSQAFDRAYHSQHGKGFHVGLASCEQLIKLHRGTITLDSSSDNNKIIATVVWPLEEQRWK